MTNPARKVRYFDGRWFTQMLCIPLVIVAISWAAQCQSPPLQPVKGTVNLVRLNSVSANFSPNGELVSTTTSVVSTINPVHPKHRVDYIATVTTASGGTPSGTVTFRDGGSLIGTEPLFGNQAQLRFTQYTRDQVGSHNITASYSGDETFAPSTSPVFTEFVKLVTRMSLATSTNPSVVGQPVTFSATLSTGSGIVQDGFTVDFYDFKTLMGSAAISGGVASFTTSSLSPKRHTIRAVFPGNDSLLPCNHALRQIVNK